jgi:hypothetical protein
LQWKEKGKEKEKEKVKAKEKEKEKEKEEEEEELQEQTRGQLTSHTTPEHNKQASIILHGLAQKQIGTRSGTAGNDGARLQETR